MTDVKVQRSYVSSVSFFDNSNNSNDNTEDTSKPIIDNVLDHENQLDTKYYSMFSPKSSGLGFRNVEYIRDPSISFASVASKHVVFDKFEYSILGDLKQAIVFTIYCEYTGIHYHSLIIMKYEDSKLKIVSKHNAHGDGSLCYPCYEAFLISKVKYWEAMNIFIFIDRKLLTKEAFYAKSW